MLIADDSDDNRHLMAASLRNAPFEILFACNGAEAVDLYRSRQPAAVLLDLHMPEMDGLTAAGRIRAVESERGLVPVPLIAFTADAFEETRRRCLAAGFTEHLVKPVPKAVLQNAIARALLTGKLDPPSPGATERIA